MNETHRRPHWRAVEVFTGPDGPILRGAITHLRFTAGDLRVMGCGPTGSLEAAMAAGEQAEKWLAGQESAETRKKPSKKASK